MSESVNSTSASTDQAIVFPKGIGGFEEYKEYRLLRSQQPDSPLYWLEAIAEPAISFTVVDPRVYGLNYVLELTEEEQALLEVTESDEVVVLLMLAKRESDEAAKPSIYGNIAGPILVNARNRLAMQKVVRNKRVELNIIGG
jgi:flagellar assembly factor FliW